MRKITSIAALLLLVSCGTTSPKNTENDQNENTVFEAGSDDQKIQDFLKEKGWQAERQESGLYVYVENEGGEAKPSATDYTLVNYKGYFLDGTVFDASEDGAISFPLNGVIKGWTEGIPHFGKGGKGKLIIPSHLGYGQRGRGSIPGGAILVFDIELENFSSKPIQKDYSPQIEAYMAEHNIDAKPTGSGLYIAIEKEGGKDKPQLNHYLTLNYEGYLLNGNSFDGTKGNPTTFPFPMSRLIPGWQEGIPYFGKGGKGKLIIPPYLGYGGQAQPNIPANSILVFDIEILDFTDQQPQ